LCPSHRLLIFKKFVWGKNIDKEFFQYKKGVSHYHFGAKALPEMIVYTFLLPCKNEKGNMTALFNWSLIDHHQIRKRYRPIMTALMPIFHS
jgi:hypothetical protein